MDNIISEIKAGRPLPPEYANDKKLVLLALRQNGEQLRIVSP